MALSRKKTVEDVDLNGKTVLMRVDFNVPFHPGTTEISDDSRIRASIPTIDYLLERNCRLVLCSHIGRPKGQFVEEMRMGPTSRRLSELLSKKVAQAEDCIGPEVEGAVRALATGEVLVLENLRFHGGEEANDPEFARSLASLADVYVDDAFGTAHRAHASTEGVTRYLPGVAGFLMARELEMLGEALDSPMRPFAAILGGAKVSDKIAVLENLAGRVDTLIIGGGMAATFLKAQGLNVGDSPVEDDRLDFAS
ncbi:MAG: phosphoglycerate kinase, partial [Chloroflexi bacterium]|nr:phosphoglycerate kinase [Chloroflexota bacterium]